MSSPVSLRAMADELIDQASSNHAHRAARTIVGGRDLTMRQTLIAIAAGSDLAEHESPVEGTLFVLTGRVELRAGADSWVLAEGDLLQIPPVRHSVHALETSAFLLSAVPGEHGH